MLSQTAIFTKLVRDYMGPPPVLVAAAEECGSVVKKVCSAQASSALVVDDLQRPLGIVTEQDICLEPRRGGDVCCAVRCLLRFDFQ